MAATKAATAGKRKPPQTVASSCSLCGEALTVSRRTFRDLKRTGAGPLCPVCRDISKLLERKQPPSFEAEFRYWLGLPEAVLDGVLVGLFGWEQADDAARERRRVLRCELVGCPETVPAAAA